MFRSIVTAVCFLAFVGAADAADAILGDWRTEAGPIAAVTPCGGAFCITLKTGRYAGKRIGRFEADGGGSYSGSITDPTNDKTYSGSAKLSGASLRLSGCVLGILCRSQTWKRK